MLVLLKRNNRKQRKKKDIGIIFQFLFRENYKVSFYSLGLVDGWFYGSAFTMLFVVPMNEVLRFVFPILLKQLLLLKSNMRFNYFLIECFFVSALIDWKQLITE